MSELSQLLIGPRILGETQMFDTNLFEYFLYIVYIVYTALYYEAADHGYQVI